MSKDDTTNFCPLCVEKAKRIEELEEALEHQKQLVVLLQAAQSKAEYERDKAKVKEHIVPPGCGWRVEVVSNDKTVRLPQGRKGGQE